MPNSKSGSQGFSLNHSGLQFARFGIFLKVFEISRDFFIHGIGFFGETIWVVFAGNFSKSWAQFDSFLYFKNLWKICSLNLQKISQMIPSETLNSHAVGVRYYLRCRFSRWAAVYRQLGASNSQWHKKKVQKSASWGKCQLGEVPVRGSASWGKKLTLWWTIFSNFLGGKILTPFSVFNDLK